MKVTRRELLRDFFILAVTPMLNLFPLEPPWCIGIFFGDKPQSLSPYERNPIISGPIISGKNKSFIATADPFLLYYQGSFWLFFEAVGEDDKGRIALAKSDDGYNWNFLGVILEKPYHLSYPCVFVYNSEIYMIPESAASGEMCIYKAEDFPFKWSVVSKIPGSFLDPTFVRIEDDLFILCNGKNLYTQYKHDLYIFTSRKIEGKWLLHSKSPIRTFRNAGNVFVLDGKLYRPYQGRKLRGDIFPIYGRYIGFVEIKLTRERYEERPISFFITPGKYGWARMRIHHISFLPNKKIAAIDGSNF